MELDHSQFSEREKEVITLLLQGKSNKQIALELHIAQSTVEYHLKNIYNKLQVSSRTEAVLRLGKSIGNETPSEVGESVVETDSKDAHNDGKSIFLLRNPMNFGCLLVTIISLLVGLLFSNTFSDTPPLKHGDIISLRAQGENDGLRWLDGITQNGKVELAPSYEAPYTGARWKVYDENEDGVISLESQGSLEGPQWLDGRTYDGTVGLAPNREFYSGTNWQVVDLGKGVIALKNLGDVDGPRWLEGQTQGGRVRLSPNQTPSDPSTSWLIIHH
jgi:DNA-binding CsgD family transcriptional regulator